MQAHEDMMSKFTAAEMEYLKSQRLGRLATVSASGEPHVVPNSFRYNPEHDTLDLGGHHLADTKKYRDALRYGRVAFVVDDVLPPWKPRMIEVRGSVEALPEGGKEINQNFSPEILRLKLTYIVSFGINDDEVRPASKQVRYSGRKV